jgi:acyl phosphate:glycerol-3-phosphate acyltransferase
MEPYWGLAIACLAGFIGGYLLGSIPFGLLFTRWAGLGDIRKIGSGNIGSTNVLRTGNKGLAAATLVADALKGTIAVLVAGHWGAACAIAAGIGAFIGHVAPVWLDFRGGKGVATYLGVLIGLFWPAAIVFGAVWLSVALLTRYSSLSALVAALAAPVFFAVAGHFALAGAAVIMSVILYLRHTANIGRLLRGEERRIGK